MSHNIRFLIPMLLTILFLMSNNSHAQLDKTKSKNAKLLVPLVPEPENELATQLDSTSSAAKVVAVQATVSSETPAIGKVPEYKKAKKEQTNSRQ